MHLSRTVTAVGGLERSGVAKSRRPPCWSVRPRFPGVCPPARSGRRKDVDTGGEPLGPLGRPPPTPPPGESLNGSERACRLPATKPASPDEWTLAGAALAPKLPNLKTAHARGLPPREAMGPTRHAKCSAQLRQDRVRGQRRARGPARRLERLVAALRQADPRTADAIVALGGDGLMLQTLAPAPERPRADLRHEPRLDRLPDERLQRGRPARSPRARRDQRHPSARHARRRSGRPDARGAGDQRGVAVPRDLPGGQAPDHPSTARCGSRS